MWAITLRSARVLLGAASVLLSAAPANAQSLYQQERAACLSGQSGQDQATCLREAAAARQEARSGRLNDGQAEFEANRLARCELQPPQDRQACIRRMNGEGVVRGNVKSGGIYRELWTPVPASRPN